MKQPIPVPVPVEIVSLPEQVMDAIPQASNGTQSQATDPSLPAKTTFQQDLISEGQRRINNMWERTQQIIAVSVCLNVLLVCTWIIARVGEDSLRMLAFNQLSNVFFLVVGTYFQRTNHTKTGGVMQDQVGR